MLSQVFLRSSVLSGLPAFRQISTPFPPMVFNQTYFARIGPSSRFVFAGHSFLSVMIAFFNAS